MLQAAPPRCTCYHAMLILIAWPWVRATLNQLGFLGVQKRERNWVHFEAVATLQSIVLRLSKSNIGRVSLGRVIHNSSCGGEASFYWEKIDCFSNLWLVPFLIIISTWEKPEYDTYIYRERKSVVLVSIPAKPPPLPLPLSSSMPACIDLLLVVSYSPDIYVCSCWSLVPIMCLSDRSGQCFNTSLPARGKKKKCNIQETYP